jgi:hypothetical protein
MNDSAEETKELTREVMEMLEELEAKKEKRACGPLFR